MKPQEKSSGKRNVLPSFRRELQAAYRELGRAIRRQPWIVQGSVNVVPPKSPTAKVTYTWTRKVRAKTKTVALSQKQAVAFRQGIRVNRRLEAALSRLRQVTQAALLAQLPGVTKRRTDVVQIADAKSVPNRA
jgi:hypothetical protein